MSGGSDTSFIESPERQALRKSVAALAANYGQEYLSLIHI